MTDDLATRLLAAIEEAEKIARTATPGQWYTPEPGDIAEWAIYGEGWVIANTSEYPSSDMANEAINLRKPATVVEHANANAAHIARHDPASVLRRCAADRKIVALHRYDHECPDAEGDGKHPIPTGFFDGNCPTMHALAKGYGLEVEERP